MKNKIIKNSFDAMVVGFLALVLWAHVPEALGRVFVWDAFRNWDKALMLPGWAYIHGLGLNMDIISSWGMGAVICISRLAQFFGGFDYAQVLAVLMVMTIIYYAVLYFFLKAWLRSALMAVALAATAIKIQMFHAGISPLIWIFPQDTAVRHWLDLPVFWCLWLHSRRSQDRYLIWAAVGVGLGLAWQLSTGLSLLAALWTYRIWEILQQRRQAWEYKACRYEAMVFLLPLLIMVSTLFLLQGGAVFSLGFWKNTLEPFRLAVQGIDTVSIFSCLHDRHFFAFIAGFVIPVIYAWSLLAGKRQEPLLVPVCVYGLVLYLHYLVHGTISHYYAVGMPLILVIGFWLVQMVQWLPEKPRTKFLVLSVLMAWGALLTNTLFIYYPGIFNISRMDWQTETNAFKSGYHFDADAAMISRLVPPGQRAAVVSGFEAKMLMQAGRAPFFYDAPLVESGLNGLGGTSLITRERLAATIGQIDAAAPEYVFVEKALLGQWPDQAAQYYPGLAAFLKYVSEHYLPQEQGTYLMALRRKKP